MLRDLNDEIAKDFFTDSGDYLKRYQTLREHQTHIGNRSKLLIDLIFSIECSLKSLIFLESNLDEKQTYQKIKTHDLSKLIIHLQSFDLSELKEVLNEDLQDINVSARYTLEANIRFRNSAGILDEFYYSTIANHTWLDKIHFHANHLYEIVRERLPKITTKSFNDFEIDKAIEIARRYNALGKKESNMPKSTTDKSYSVKEIRETHHQAYMPWTTENDEKLELLFCEGKSVKELSELFEREPGAIKSRIKKLELKDKYRT